MRRLLVTLIVFLSVVVSYAQAGVTASPETLAELKTIIALTSKGQYQAAETAARDLLARVEKTAGPQSLDAAKVIDTLTENMWLGGKARSPEARALIDRSIVIKERLLGPDHPETAFSLRNLATLLQHAGNFSAARPLFERVLVIQEKALGPDNAQVGWTSVNFGILLKDLGDYTAARASLERALRIYEAIKLETAIAIASSNLVDVLAKLKDYPGAKRHAERALEISLKRNGPNHPSTASNQANLAAVLALMIEHAAAKPLFESALAVLVQTLGSDHPTVADVTHNLAECLQFLGDPAGAKALYARATAIYEKTWGPDHPSFSDHLLAVASFLGQTGDTTEAVDLALRAERISRDHTQLTVREFAERQGLTFAGARVSSMDFLLSLVTKRPTDTEAARPDVWDALIRGRALMLDEMGTRHHVSAASRNVEVAQLVKELTAARGRLATLAVRGAERYTPAQYRTLVDQARREKERAEEALALKSLPFRADVGRSRIGLKDVMAALPPDSGLVAFVRFGQYELGEERQPGKPPRSFPSYMALVVRGGGGDLTPVSLGTAQTVDGQVSRWRDEVAQEALAPGRASGRMETSYRVVATELRQKVWDPIAPHLKGLKRVFVVPDGSLHLVNFAALPVGQTGYLVENGPTIHYLSAERDLVLTAQVNENSGMLALGSPAFDDTRALAAQKPVPGAGVQPLAGETFRGSRSTCGPFESMQFAPLPESAREAKEIAALWQKTRGSVRSLNGAEATEGAFKREASGKRVLHLATHGFFLDARCASTLDAKGEQPPPGLPAVAAGENPMLLSGLVLAGANHRKAAQEGEEDGILTAEEIAAMNLSGVEWAVLSACDTGVGAVKAGEGVFGLRRAFQVAGVRTIIMSLWAVEDQAARQWMTALYESRFVKGLNTAQAVHQASARLLAERRAKGQSTHPFYWAGFVAAGDWR